MKLPKIYKRLDNDQSIRRTVIDVERLPIVNYEPDVDMDDDKSVEKYIKEIKRTIRTSLEYKELVKFLKSKMHFDRCFFMPNVRKSRDADVSIELHHTALVMEDIVRIVLRKRFIEGEDYDVQSVANEVMFEHYAGDISLTALSSTAHSLIHEDNSCLFIPLQMVDFGDVELFVEKYSRYIPKDLSQKFGQYKILSDAIKNIDDIIPHDLDRNFIYYRCKDGVNIPKIDEVMKLIGDNE